MEEILASIRRILNEDDPAAAPAPAYAPPDDDVLELDQTMLVDHAAQAAALPAASPSAPPPAPPPPMEVPAMPPANSMADDLDGLVAPAAAAAAASAFGGLSRSLSAAARPAPSAQVWGGGPTLEDIVRSELRPLLKDWLDANLPPMVERLVRAEIEKVAGRQGS
jgi:hypothetical protein